MWSIIGVISFIALSNALKSNLSLLEGKLIRGDGFDEEEVNIIELDFVVSIQYKNENTEIFEHLCLGCMITSTTGVFPSDCKLPRKKLYITTNKDGYSNEKLRLIDHFEVPDDKIEDVYEWIEFFVMKEPLWEGNNPFELTEFKEMPNLREFANGRAVVWNQLVENPLPNEKLLSAPIRIPYSPINTLRQRLKVNDLEFKIGFPGQNLFKFQLQDRGAPVFFNDTAIGIIINTEEINHAQVVRIGKITKNSGCTWSRIQ